MPNEASRTIQGQGDGGAGYEARRVHERASEHHAAQSLGRGAGLFGACIVLLLAALWLATADVRADAITTIPVERRPAGELIPILRPLLGPDDALTASGSTLILRTDPDTAAQVQALVRQLDRPPASLLIRVRRASLETTQRQGIRAGVRLESGDVRFEAGAAVEHGVSVTAQRRERSTAAPREHAIRTVEGVPTLLQGAGEVEATVRLTGADRMQIALRSTGARGGAALDTIIAGRLGEWLTVGGVADRAVETRHGILERGSGASRRSETIQIRVDRLNDARPGIGALNLPTAKAGGF